MRKYLPLLAIIVLSLTLNTACVSYQYAFVDSDIREQKTKNYSIEDDTVSIKYTFSGPELQVSVNIYNKLAQPVYIDMERSLLVYNGRQYNNIFSGAGNLGFIAPGSHVTISSNPITIGMLDIAGNDSTSMIRTSAGLVKRYLYTDENSPVKIRCLLAIATNEYYDQPTFYDTPFWISDIIPSSLSPKTDFDYSREKFYMSKEREGLKLLGYTVAILLSLVLLGASG